MKNYRTYKITILKGTNETCLVVIVISFLRDFHLVVCVHLLDELLHLCRCVETHEDAFVHGAKTVKCIKVVLKKFNVNYTVAFIV